MTEMQPDKKCDKLLALAQFSEELTTIEDNDRLYEFLIDNIIDIIKCDQASLMIFNSKTKKLETMKVRGFDLQGYIPPRLESAQDVSKWIYDEGEVFALSADQQNRYLILFNKDESKYFNCELRIPLFSKRDMISMINIGKKSKGTEYSEHDITILRIFANLASIAIDNASLSNRTASQKHRDSEAKKELVAQKSWQIKRRVEEVKMIGKSDAINHIHEMIERVATKDVTVLITGESGTGKDLVARSIHQKSYRHDKPFVAMNCAALPENLVESELFGHEKGAFTGAHAQKKGKFEYAEGGTLLLDEIGDMSLTTQAKLLRVLQDGTYQRTGGNTTLKANVRVIAATNKNLYNEIRDGNFREDLYYRINVVQIYIPPLRDRVEDIPYLAEYFFRKYNDFYEKGINGIESNEMQRLMEYHFPGNVRELQNIIERAVIMSYGENLSMDFIPSSKPELNAKQTTGFGSSLADLEKEHIKNVLHKVNYNKSQAAKILGIARKTLREKIQKYEL